MTKKYNLIFIFILFYFSCELDSSSENPKQELRGFLLYPEVTVEVGNESSFSFDEQEISLPLSEIDNFVEYEITPNLPSGILFEKGKLTVTSKAKIQQKEIYNIKMKLKETDLFKESLIEGKITIKVNKKKISGILTYPDLILLLGESGNIYPQKNITPFFAKEEKYIYSFKDDDIFLPKNVTLDSTTGKISISSGFGFSNKYTVIAKVDENSTKYVGEVSGDVVLQIKKKKIQSIDFRYPVTQIKNNKNFSINPTIDNILPDEATSTSFNYLIDKVNGHPFPSNISIDEFTGEIKISPINTVFSNTYKIKAIANNNEYEGEFTTDVSIDVRNKLLVSGAIEYNEDKIIIEKGTVKNINIDKLNISPSGASGIALEYSIDNTAEKPSLATGLTINSSTGVISIANNAVISSNEYTLQANVPSANADYEGFIQKKIRIIIEKKKITGTISYSATSATGGVVTTITPTINVTPTIAVGNLNFSLKDSDSLNFPSGISLDQSSGVITISVDTLAYSNTFPILATIPGNDADYQGSIEVEVSIKVDKTELGGILTYDKITAATNSDVEYKSSVLFNGVTPARGKDASIIYSLDTSGGKPAFPSGVFIDNKGNVLVEKNYTGALFSNTYTIKGTVDNRDSDYKGAITGTISIECIDRPILTSSSNSVTSFGITSIDDVKIGTFTVNSAINIKEIIISPFNYDFDNDTLGYDNAGAYVAFGNSGSVTIGGVSSISYNYDSIKKQWKLTKTGNFTAANVKSILDQISFKAGNNSLSFIREVEFYLVNIGDISSLKKTQVISYIKKYFVGATNIGHNSADIIFPMMNNRTIDIYLNTTKATDLTSAKSGTKTKTESNVGHISISGLVANFPTNVSVVSVNGATETFIGSYSFTTGASLYLDGTVPEIATNLSKTWFNIANTGANQNAKLFNIDYNLVEDVFESPLGGNLIFDELEDIRALFLVAELTNKKSLLAGHVIDNTFLVDEKSDRLVANEINNEYSRGAHWLVKDKIENINDFLIISDIVTYGVRVENTIDFVKANQLRNKFDEDTLWKGKFEKYLIFTSVITEDECQSIINFLEKERLSKHGKIKVTGKLLYQDIKIVKGSSQDRDVIIEDTHPFGSRDVGFGDYVLDTSSPAFPTGISVNNTSGKITVAINTDITVDTYRIKATIKNNASYDGEVHGDIFISVGEVTLTRKEEGNIFLYDENTPTSLGTFDIESKNNANKIKSIKLAYSEIISENSSKNFQYKDNNKDFKNLTPTSANNITISNVIDISYTYDVNEKTWTFSKNNDFTIEEAEKIINNFYYILKKNNNIGIDNNSFRIRLKDISSVDIEYNGIISKIDTFVGATNISDNRASVVYSVFPTHTTYKIYSNVSKVKAVNEARSGTLLNTSTGVSFESKKQNFSDINSLSKNSTYYISIVAEESGLDTVFLGTYGFVTGTKLYWDATVPNIANSSQGKWFNITSFGSQYDGIIGNNGQDYSYNLETRAFDNDDENKNISFEEIDKITAIFLVAQIDNNEAFLAGYNSNDGDQYFHSDTTSQNLVFISDNVQDDWDANGEYWIGKTKVIQPNFNRIEGKIGVYGFRTTTLNSSLKANQTAGNSNPRNRVWKGKYQKYIIYDTAITESEAENISKFLDDN